MGKNFVFVELFTIMMVCGCGNAASDSQHDSSADTSDSLPASEFSSMAKPSHETDNFFVLNVQGDGIYVGNNIDYMRKLDCHDAISVSISPDGKHIAHVALEDGIAQLRIIDVNTMKSKKIHLGSRGVYGVEYSPDGRFLAFSCFDSNSEWNVALMNLSTLKYEFITKRVAGDFLSPTFSPDGEFLVTHNVKHIFIYKLNNGDPVYYKSVSSCELCQRNDLAIQPESRFQLASDHNHLIYMCQDYSADRPDVSRLMSYSLSDGVIEEIVDNEYSCLSFQVSDDNNVYFIRQSPDHKSHACMTNISDINPVGISDKSFEQHVSISVAY